MDKLPIDIVRHILTYDKHFTIRKNILTQIIPRDDYRFTMLLNRQRIKNNHVIIKKPDECSVHMDVVPCKNYFIWRMVVLNTVEATNKIYSHVIK
jgi:hypothetical protein